MTDLTSYEIVLGKLFGSLLQILLLLAGMVPVLALLLLLGGVRLVGSVATYEGGELDVRSDRTERRHELGRVARCTGAVAREEEQVQADPQGHPAGSSHALAFRSMRSRNAV